MMQCNDSIWLTESILTQLMPSALPRVKDARPSHLIVYTCLSLLNLSVRCYHVLDKRLVI